MSQKYRIFGAELSPYSVKTRSYFRYKNIPHKWVIRSPANADEFQKYARLPIVPLVITPENEGIQDSTCLLYTSPSPRDGLLSRMPSSA